jgi:hypothetical protein
MHVVKRRNREQSRSSSRKSLKYISERDEDMNLLAEKILIIRFKDDLHLFPVEMM